jgi:transcription elongation factor GreA
MERVHMTPEGFRVLEEELKNLKFVERASVVAAIAEARSLGDLSENAEYMYAKNKQGFVEGRIKELESKLSRAEIIDITKIKGSDVKFGCTVTLCDIATDEEITYKIVGMDEANIKKCLLSIESPLAKALIGRSVGDEVKVTVPSGKKEYEIVDIKYV